MPSEKRKAQNREAQRRLRSKRRAEVIEAVKQAGGLPERPDRETLLRLLGIQARNGHVTAIRLLLEEYRRDGDQTDEAFSVLDELAARRAPRR
jgi:hypothetical protein